MKFNIDKKKFKDARVNGIHTNDSLHLFHSKTL